MPSKPQKAPTWRNRVKELRYVSSRDIADHPLQHKVHPHHQTSVLRGILGEVGIADVLLAYVSPQTGRLTAIDGHLRKQLGDVPWPTVILDVDDDEAAYLLALGDEVGLLAEKDAPALLTLLARVQAQDPTVQALLDDLRALHGGESVLGQDQTESATQLARYSSQPVLDVDPYGSPWSTLEGFFISARTYAPSMAVVVTDGGRQKMRLGGFRFAGWESWQNQYGPNLWAVYLRCCRERLTSLVASAGYEVVWWHGQYSRTGQQTYFAAALRYIDGGSLAAAG